MRNIKLTMTCLACVLFMSFSYGQDVKVGYTNVELVLAYMPEAKSMEQTLATYQRSLGEKLQVKQNYAQSKLDEYMKLREANQLVPAEDKRRQEELQKLDQEIQQLAAESEQELMAKRQELLEPILTKLQNAINKVAESNGFTYIMNQTTSAGVSTILYGPEENDMTEAIMKELGIQIPTGN